MLIEGFGISIEYRGDDSVLASRTAVARRLARRVDSSPAQRRHRASPLRGRRRRPPVSASIAPATKPGRARLQENRRGQCQRPVIGGECVLAPAWRGIECRQSPTQASTKSGFRLIARSKAVAGLVRTLENVAGNAARVPRLGGVCVDLQSPVGRIESPRRGVRAR